MQVALIDSSSYSCVPWEEDSVDEVVIGVQHAQRLLRRIQPGSDVAALLSSHAHWATIVSIYFSNRIEDAGVSLPDTALLCSEPLLHGTSSTISSSDPREPPISTEQREVVQHAAALKLLHDWLVVDSEPLTVSIICDAHRVLMRGMRRRDSMPVSAGTFRKAPCYAGLHAFLPHTIIPRCLASLVADYNERSSSSDEEEFDPFAGAAWLSYEFVFIRHFEDGNGRISRLLLNMALMRSGVPIPIALGFSSSHKKAKAQYLHCITNAQARMGRTTRLAFVVLCAFRDLAGGFLDNVRIAYPEEFRALCDGA